MAWLTTRETSKEWFFNITSLFVMVVGRNGWCRIWKLAIQLLGHSLTYGDHTWHATVLLL